MATCLELEVGVDQDQCERRQKFNTVEYEPEGSASQSRYHGLRRCHVSAEPQERAELPQLLPDAVI